MSACRSGVSPRLTLSLEPALRNRGETPLLQLAFVFVLLIAGCDSAEKATNQAPPLSVLVTQSIVEDVPLSMDLVGTTMGTQDVPIRTRVEGYLETMEFEEGTFVKKGDTLYTIDAQPFQAKLVAAQSQLAGAQTSRAKTQSDLARIRPLAEIKAVSEQDLDSAVAQEAAARANVRASEANVELAEIELGYTRIHAPIDGLIGLTKAKPGEFVGRDPNPVVLNTLSDIDPIRVRFSISSRVIMQFARTRVMLSGPLILFYCWQMAASIPRRAGLLPVRNPLAPKPARTLLRLLSPIRKGCCYPGSLHVSGRII